jgi:hypothetical protein
MKDTISEEKLAKYLDTTKRALDKLKIAAPEILLSGFSGTNRPKFAVTACCGWLVEVSSIDLAIATSGAPIQLKYTILGMGLHCLRIYSRQWKLHTHTFPSDWQNVNDTQYLAR